MSAPPLAALAVESPATLLMSARARALRADGHPVISLAIGEPDFPTPPHVIEAAHRAALDGQTRYTPVEGTPALRRAIAARFATEHGIETKPDRVIVTTGAKQAIHDAFAATIDPGAEIVIPAPYWASYPLIAAMLGGVPVFVPCHQRDGFRLDPASLAAAITPRTRWVVLNAPNNPTGAILDRDRLDAIAAILARHPDLWVLSDDIYEHLIHDGTPHGTIAALSAATASDPLGERVLTISGVSKTHAMTGWRIGWAIGPRRLIERMAVVQGNTTSGASSIGQAAALAALEGPQDHVAERRLRFRDRRDRILAILRETPLLDTPVPDGAFYLFPSIAGLLGRSSPAGRTLATDQDVAIALLEEAHVATVHGAAFGGPGHLRISIAADEASLVEAARRIVRFCQDAS